MSGGGSCRRTKQSTFIRGARGGRTRGAWRLASTTIRTSCWRSTTRRMSGGGSSSSTRSGGFRGVGGGARGPYAEPPGRPEAGAGDSPSRGGALPQALTTKRAADPDSNPKLLRRTTQCEFGTAPGPSVTPIPVRFALHFVQGQPRGAPEEVSGIHSSMLPGLQIVQREIETIPEKRFGLHQGAIAGLARSHQHDDGRSGERAPADLRRFEADCVNRPSGGRFTLTSWALLKAAFLLPGRRNTGLPAR